MGGQGGNSLTETADIKKTRWTLQVQAVLCPCRKTGTSALPGHPERDFAASLALEASLALSLFIFTVILIAIPIDMLDTQRRIQMTVEAAAREAAQAAVLLRKDAAPSEDQEQKAGLGRELLTSAGVQVYLLKKAQDAGAPKIEGLSVSGSGIRENGDEVDFRAEYRIRLPFRVFTLSAVPFSARSRKHGWTGSDKKAGGGGSSGGREDKTVYVGRDSTRYHCSASCHYISNEIHRVSARSLPGLRNESGSSYRPCRVCGGADASEYFVLPAGETYHTKANCSSLSYYVRAVPLSEVEHLGPCSYCGGG